MGHRAEGMGQRVKCRSGVALFKKRYHSANIQFSIFNIQFAAGIG
jgi:hypothetical protein